MFDVSIVKCLDYSENNVKSKLLEISNGLVFIKAGMKIAIKVKNRSNL